MGRSRSPRGQENWDNWISRQVAGFGRHPNKRPRGLEVDHNGNMWLDQLMDSWARSQNVKEQQVLNAVRANMFHEDGQMRFSINQDNDEGRTVIRVLPKRDRWARGNNVAATSSSTPKGNHQRASWAGRPTPEKNGAPPMRGSIWRQQQTIKAMPKVPFMQPPSSTTNTVKKLDMSLDEVIKTEAMPMHTETAPYEMEAAGGYYGRTAYHDQQATNVRRHMEQMGLTGSSAQVRLPPPRSTRERERGQGKRGAGKGAWAAPQDRARSVSPNFRRTRDRDISRSPTPDVDEALAKAAVRSLRVSGDSGGRAPPPPPGSNWTKYADEGTVWWYYEGSLGKWWVADGEKTVQRYGDSDEEE